MEQGSPEWFAARCGKVTASRVADVIAKTKTGPSASRLSYMGELIAERLTGVPAEGFTNAAMQHGIDTEPLARAKYESLRDVMVEPFGFIDHPSIANSGASPDGGSGEGLLEVKCPKTHTHIEYLMGGEPPKKYVPQMAWQCACTRRPWVDFVSFDPRMPEDLQLFVVRYEPSATYLKELEAAVAEFLEEMESKLAALRGIAQERNAA